MQRSNRAIALAGVALLACASGALSASDASDPASPMNLERMDEILRSLATGEVRREEGAWEFEFFGTRMACVTSLEHNRMRIFTPITTLAEITMDQQRRILEANFHTALDARYAASGGTLYSAFLHPLTSLSEAQLRSAVLQVASLARTFGSEYSSGVLSYGQPGTGT